MEPLKRYWSFLTGSNVVLGEDNKTRSQWPRCASTQSQLRGLKEFPFPLGAGAPSLTPCSLKIYSTTRSRGEAG